MQKRDSKKYKYLKINTKIYKPFNFDYMEAKRKKWNNCNTIYIIAMQLYYSDLRE